MDQVKFFRESKKKQKKLIQQLIIEPNLGKEQLNDEDTKFMHALISSKHPDKSKLRNFSHFKVMTKPYYPGNKTFNMKVLIIVRTDGTEDDVSYVKCIDLKNETQDKKERARKAMRQVVDRFINEVYVRPHKSEKQDVCALCEKPLDIENVDHDHYEVKFADLRDMWLHQKELKLEDITAEDDDTTCGRLCFKDKKLEDDWYNFHADRCHIERVHKECNAKKH